MEVFVTDKQILQEVKGDIALLAEVQYRILSKKLHNQIMELTEEAVASGNVQMNTVEDLLTLIELDLLLS